METKTSYKGYFAWDYEKEEAMLNEKSSQGWHMVKGGCFHSVFEKDETKQYCYRIDFNMNLIKDADEKKRYIEMNRELGWEFINVTFNGWIYLRKEFTESSDKNDYEIYTDIDSFNAMMDRWIHFSYGMIVVVALFTFAYFYMFFVTQQIAFIVYSIVFILASIFVYRGSVLMKAKKK